MTKTSATPAGNILQRALDRLYSLLFCTAALLIIGASQADAALPVASGDVFRIPAVLPLEVGVSGRFSVAYAPSSQDLTPIEWHIEDTSIATIAPLENEQDAYVVTPHKTGETTLVATIGRTSKLCQITVAEPRSKTAAAETSQDKTGGCNQGPGLSAALLLLGVLAARKKPLKE